MDIMACTLQIFICLILLIISGGSILQIYTQIKMLSLFKYLEFKEAFRANSPDVQSMGFPRTINPSSFVSGNISKQDENGGFVGKTDESAYIQEEARKLSMAAGISDNDAIGLILEKMNEQRENSGNVGQV
jgi:hypothetical protein